MGSCNDPLADLLTRLRNASRARHRYIDVDHSKMKEAVTKILKKKGFVAHYLYKEEKKKGTLRIFFKIRFAKRACYEWVKKNLEAIFAQVCFLWKNSTRFRRNGNLHCLYFQRCDGWGQCAPAKNRRRASLLSMVSGKN